MDKQTISAFALISVIIIIWLYINQPKPQPPHQKPTAAAVDSITAKKDAAPVQQKQVAEQIADDTTGSAKLFPRTMKNETIITVENELARYELTSKGGKLKRVWLKDYNNWYTPAGIKNKDVPTDCIQLLNVKKGSSIDVEFLTGDGKKISTSLLEFTSSVREQSYKISKGDSLTISYSFSPDGTKTIKKAFTFYGDKYDSKFELAMNGFYDFVSGNSYDILWDAGIRTVEENSVDESNYSNSSVYYGGEQVKIDAPGSGEKIEKDFNGQVDWVCVRNKYFAAVLAPENPSAANGALVRGYASHYANGGRNEFYSLRYKMPLKSNTNTTSFLVYLGPVKYSILKTYDKKFIEIVDFGSFFGLKFIVRPIAEYIFLPMFNFLHGFIPNYGLVIILFSIIVKVLLHPLSRKSLVSMQKMQLLQPKLTEIKETYKDDPTKLNKEMMKLYSTYGINPAGGCLPMIGQMPIFIALWGLFQTAVELRQQPFIWWIKDLSRPDIILSLPFKIPIFGVSQISALATLMGITMFVQQKMSVKDPSQKALVYIMPIMFTFMFMSFPAGLNLYYFLFNLLSIAQQYYLTHHTEGLKLEPVKKSGKKGLMEKMMAAAEEKSRSQSQSRKK